MTLKDSFRDAVASGKLGVSDGFGTVVTLKEFKEYFQDIETGYITSFMPASVIEVGQSTATHTKFLFRIKKGVYRVHPAAIEEFCEKHNKLNKLATIHHGQNKINNNGFMLNNYLI